MSRLGRLGVMGSSVMLRPVEELDLVVFRRFLIDPTVTGEFEWFGYRADRIRELERRWHGRSRGGGR